MPWYVHDPAGRCTFTISAARQHHLHKVLHLHQCIMGSRLCPCTQRRDAAVWALSSMIGIKALTVSCYKMPTLPNVRQPSCPVMFWCVTLYKSTATISARFVIRTRACSTYLFTTVLQRRQLQVIKRKLRSKLSLPGFLGCRCTRSSFALGSFPLPFFFIISTSNGRQ